MRDTNKTKRCMFMIRAYLVYHARKVDQQAREHESWAYLLEWARLGGLPREVVGLEGTAG